LSTRLQRLVAEMMDSGIRLDQAVREFERQFILAALEKNRGNRSLAARSLGVHRNTLRNKIQNHGEKV
jgi:DNA-binding NtrC family response regulator